MAASRALPTPVSSPRASHARARAWARACRIVVSVPGASRHPRAPARSSRLTRAASRAVQPLLISQHLHVADSDRAVGDRDRDIDQHSPRIMPGPAFQQTIGRLAQRCRQTDPVRELGQQHRPGVRRHPRPVTGDTRLRPARCAVHARSASPTGDVVPWARTEAQQDQALSRFPDPCRTTRSDP